tara:strand:- start:348 stop:473 length:126 start_codon:yes stop_codon:yes gene_type:complete
MNDIVTVIQQVGFPIAAALGLGWLIQKYKGYTIKTNLLIKE